MTTFFKKPPLVELMAELRWGLPTLGLAQGAQGPLAVPGVAGADGKPLQIQFSLASAYDAFFMSFAVQAHKMGFTMQERIVPPNMILLPYQTVWRWRKPDVEGLFLQLGPGVFTVNGAPPNYKQWKEFLPTVRDGVAGLIATFDSYPDGRPTCFNQTLLRYIDLFDYDSVKSQPPLSFLSEVMGVKIELPSVLTNIANEDGFISPQLNLSIPLKDGAVQLLFTHGTVGGRTGHIFDTTVIRNGEFGLDPDSVTASFTNSHAITNGAFMALTKPLHSEMEPEDDQRL